MQRLKESAFSRNSAMTEKSSYTSGVYATILVTLHRFM